MLIELIIIYWNYEVGERFGFTDFEIFSFFDIKNLIHHFYVFDIINFVF